MSPAPDHAARRTGNLFDVARVRAEFPILEQTVNGRPLVYLDNGATSQKPRRVIDAIRRYYETDNANVHRGLHALSERATNDYEGARDTVRAFLNAADRREIVFVRGATEGLNLVAQSWARPRLRPDDEIVVTTMEHHSNIVPWQLVCRQTGARLRVVPIHDSGELDMEAFSKLVNERTRIVAVAHVSNALGTINPVREIIATAHDAGAVAVLDGAQAAAHGAVDVRALGCDFYVFSSHKCYGPTGMGVLYGRTELLEEAEPYQGRRRHDPHRLVRGVDLERSALQVRGGDPEHCGHHRARRRRRIHDRPRDGTPSPRTSTRSWSTPPRCSVSSKACASSAPLPRRPGSCPSSSTACILTTSAPSSIGTGWRSGPDTIARCR